MNFLHSQRGAALITAMMIVTIATAIAYMAGAAQRLDIRRTENVLLSEQSFMYLLGAEDWAKSIIKQDDRSFDAANEAWATAITAIPISGGSISGALEDLQGRFNLNSIVLGDQIVTVAMERFDRLLERLQIDRNIALAIADWIDEDIEAQGALGAEDNYYLGLEGAYRTANRPMASVTELRLIRGITLEVYAKLLPHVTVLPSGTSINVNTASVELLGALHPDLDGPKLESLTQRRDSAPFESMAALESYFKNELDLQIDTMDLSIATTYFGLTAVANVGRVKVTLKSILFRQRDGIQTLQRSRGEL